MLDYIRIALYVALVAIGLFIYQAWEKDHPNVPLMPQQISNNANTTIPNRYLPEVQTNANNPELSQANATTPPNATTAPTAATQSNTTNTLSPQTATATVAPSQAAPTPIATVNPPVPPTGKFIHVKTDTYDLTIDTLGGDIVAAHLLKYPESLNSKNSFTLLNDQQKTRYVAESGLLSTIGPDTSKAQALYTTDQDQYELSPDQKELLVQLHWQKDGLQINKVFTFTRGSYQIDVNYVIHNQSSETWNGSFYAQLARTDVPPESHGGLVNLTTYFGAALSSPDKRFNKISFKDIREQNLQQTIQGGWAAMIQHYFISAWIPDPSVPANYYTRVTPNGLYVIGMITPAISVAPNASAETAKAKLYTGPAIPDQMEKVAPGLKLTVDYGLFWFISDLIFWMMQKIHEVIGNWGWSIVLVTVIIKLLFYQLSAKSYRSMSALKKLQPRLELLKERYGDDRQKLTQATLELYKQEKVNPMSGCLPILIQIPVFIALYWVLVESVELRQAPFILWIRDLSQPDPFYVLPVLMGISMFLQQRLSPPPPDPTQAKIMMLMPVIFTVLFANFPSGLMLYWFVNNTLSVLQQWYVMHKLNHVSKK